MTVITRAEDFNADDLYVDLEPVLGQALHLKCEGFNFAGSIKLKAAQQMVSAAEDRGMLRPGSTIVESSSGNLGVALSVIAAGRGYRFVCVTDAKCNETVRLQMQALGAQVHVVTEPAGERGLVGARIDLVRRLCAQDPTCVWLNQYENPDNWAAHFHGTGPEIAKQFPDLDVLFVGAGTTGTLTGSARFFREYKPQTRIVAIDVAGSVLFGGPPGPRRIPGLGNHITPGIFDPSIVDEVVIVDEAETVRMCRRLARHGFLFGGSTGSVVSGALSWLASRDRLPGSAVAVAPDFGVPYLNTVYRAEWVRETYGAAV
ncbi:2,3-diaminopropionate biosynthesis protein SbnA [Amycolatopsis benzoatilytica]|uniref:2,3-diaminopropionate biosynthesis protein SbnA n=1 Tax=Amycolatopsis benzoatilytica TaxID=346045 RepID=UPI00036426F1|nr:2,3-diaminopropionate biosynthesis protein SbnA [Amycolatopsis benzoatilytica]